MSNHAIPQYGTAQYLVLHYYEDELVAGGVDLAETLEEAELISSAIRDGDDSLDMVVVPIAQAAVAPELLKVCKQSVSFLRDWALTNRIGMGIVRRMQAAIAKAEGGEG